MVFFRGLIHQGLKVEGQPGNCASNVAPLQALGALQGGRGVWSSAGQIQSKRGAWAVLGRECDAMVAGGDEAVGWGVARALSPAVSAAGEGLLSGILAGRLAGTIILC